MNICLNLTLQTARRFIVGLLIFNLIMALLYLGNMALPEPIPFLREFLNLDGERSLPTWFSSIQLLAIGVVFLLIAHRKKNLHTETSTSFPLSHKFLVTAGWVFIFFSMDEIAMFHERINFLLAPLSWLPRFALDHGIWISVYAAAGFVLLILLRTDIWNFVLKMRSEALFLALGFGIFIAGGIAFEILANLFLRMNENSLLYYTEVAIEELLEMVGASLMLYGAIRVGNRLERDAVVLPETVPLAIMGESHPV